MQICYISNLLQEHVYGRVGGVLAWLKPRLTLSKVWSGEVFNGPTFFDPKFTSLSAFSKLCKFIQRLLSVELPPYNGIVWTTDR